MQNANRKTKNHTSKPSSLPSFPSVPSFRGFLCLLVAASALPGCSLRPLQGGHALTTGPVTQSLAQSENPSRPSIQEQETTRTYAIPGFPINPAIQESINPRLLLTEHIRARSELGAAQKDTARELAAKLSSLKGIVWVGVALFIFGIASAFWPPLKVVIGSVTTSAAISAGGLALIVLPTMVVGHELLIFGFVAATTAAWFLAHRHGQLRGLLNAHLQQPEIRNPKSAIK